MHFSSECFKVQNAILVHVATTALTLYGTSQFIEARKSNYANFKKRDVYLRAKTILRRQLMMLYHWSLTRYCIENPLRIKQIRKDAFKISMDNFDVTIEEINKYIDNPKFLWRFSARNYDFFVTFFKSHRKSKLFYSRFETADIDDSPLVDYVKPLNNYLKDKLKKTFNYDITSMKRYYNYDTDYILNFMKTHLQSINEYESAEFLYSDDYYLHEVQPDAKYEDFVCHLLCGLSSKKNYSPLLNWHIENRLFQKAKKISDNPNINTILKFKLANLAKLKTSKILSDEFKLYSDLSLKTLKFDQGHLVEKVQPVQSTVDENSTTVNPVNPVNPVKTINQLNPVNSPNKPNLKKIKNINFDVSPKSLNKVPDDLMHAYDFMFPEKNQNPALRLECIKEIVAFRRKSFQTTHRFFHTDWLHEYRMKVNNIENSFYKIALKTFGSKCNMQFFRFDDKHGVSVRTGWAVPCPVELRNKISKIFLESAFSDEEDYETEMLKLYEECKDGFKYRFNPTILIEEPDDDQTYNFRYDCSFGAKVNDYGFNFSAMFDPELLDYDFTSTENTIVADDFPPFTQFHLRKFEVFQNQCIDGLGYTGVNDTINSLLHGNLSIVDDTISYKSVTNNPYQEIIDDDRLTQLSLKTKFKLKFDDKDYDEDEGGSGGGKDANGVKGADGANDAKGVDDSIGAECVGDVDDSNGAGGVKDIGDSGGSGGAKDAKGVKDVKDVKGVTGVKGAKGAKGADVVDEKMVNQIKSDDNPAVSNDKITKPPINSLITRSTSSNSPPNIFNQKDINKSTSKNVKIESSDKTSLIKSADAIIDEKASPNEHFNTPNEVDPNSNLAVKDKINEVEPNKSLSSATDDILLFIPPMVKKKLNEGIDERYKFEFVDFLGIFIRGSKNYIKSRKVIVKDLKIAFNALFEVLYKDVKRVEKKWKLFDSYLTIDDAANRSDKIIPFQAGNYYPGSRATQCAVGWYLCAYYARFHKFGVSNRDAFFLKVMEIQKKSKHAAYVLYLFARDRYVSQLFYEYEKHLKSTGRFKGTPYRFTYDLYYHKIVEKHGLKMLLNQNN